MDIHADIERCINSLAEKFLKWPFNFFTESDAHSFLYYYIFRSGSRELKQQYPTANPQIKTVLVHREYPTSFRYKKEGMELNDTGGRGHYDLVVLNPDFMKEHSINEIIAKNFKKCCVNEKHHLLTAIEFKLVVSPLSKNLREEIAKDFTKLTWSLESQAQNAYMVIFNRVRPEVTYYEELNQLAQENPQVKAIYVESVKEPKRHYHFIYLNNWANKLRFT
ncbi:MAG: hypothetical protein PHU36_04480 [Syntrophomonadaceae bacterium]|nr:hypothetical protein [Syntrophomonadaceae bacterium]